MSALNIAEVKSVHRLAVFQHYIVCDVDEVVDRTNTACTESLSHPAGGGTYLNVLYDTCTVSRAGLSIVDIYLKEAVYIAVNSLEFRSLYCKGKVICSGSLSCKTDNAEAVRAVRGYLKLNRGIVKADSGVNILTEAALLLDNENSLRVSIGEVMSSKSEGLKAAEHTEAFNSTHLALLYLSFGKDCTVKSNRHKVALLDVFSVCNYLDRGICSDVHLANEESVSIFVRSL